MVCTECGEELSDRAKFCAQCGAKIPEELKPTEPEPAQPTPESTPESTPTKKTSGSRILIVDDNSNITSILNEMFSELGCWVLTAGNVDEALEVLTENRVDLVVTDIVMPGLSGLSLISDIQTNYPKTKIIAISNGGEKREHLENYLKAAKAKGAVRCLPKPFKVMDLVVMVKEVLEENQG